MLNTLSDEMASFDQLFDHLCSALHIPLVNTVVGERRMDVMNSFIIQTSVCLKRDNRTAAPGEKDKAVVTNEGTSQ